MSIARKDDRHNEDLVREIADGFNRAVGAGSDGDENGGGNPPRFVVTGDKRRSSTEPTHRMRDNTA